MFHVKHRQKLAVLLAFVLLGSFTIACGGRNPSRGWAAPVVAGDRVLVSTGKGRLDALDAQTRLALWRFPNAWSIPEKGARRLSGIYGPPVMSQDGRVVYVGDYNGYVYAFRPSDLEVATSEKPRAAALKLSGPIIGGLALDSTTDTLFATSGERVFRISASQLAGRIDNRDAPVNHEQLLRTGADIWATPVLASGRVYIASLDGSLYAIDAKTGNEIWRFTSERPLASTPALVDGTLLVGGFDDRLFAVDASTGSQKWDFVAANWVWTRPANDASRAYIGDFNGNLYALDLGSGAEAWNLPLKKGAIRGSPALAGGTLVVATEDGWLVGIDPASQASRWERKLETSFNADLVAQGGNVFIAPAGCVRREESTEKTYYASVNAQNGELTSVEGVC